MGRSGLAYLSCLYLTLCASSAINGGDDASSMLGEHIYDILHVVVAPRSGSLKRRCEMQICSAVETVVDFVLLNT